MSCQLSDDPSGDIDHGWTPLHHAAAQDRVEEVQTLLVAGKFTETGDESGRTPLHCAAQYGSIGVLQALLKAGASIGATDDELNTPLHLAAESSNADVVRALLEAGAKSDVQDTMQNTPLHWAAIYGRAEAVRLLLEAGADANVQNACGKTPLHHACEVNPSIGPASHPEIVRALVEAGANINHIGGCKAEIWAPLHIAVQCGAIDVVRMLLALGAETDVRSEIGWSPLHLAVYRNHTGVVRELLKAGADVNTTNLRHDNRTPLHDAVRNANPVSLDLLLQAGATCDVSDASGATPLQYAIKGASEEGHHPGIVRSLVHAGAKRVCEFSPLHCAARYSNSAVVQALVDSGMDKNVRIDVKRPGYIWGYISAVEGSTPLHVAALRPSSEGFEIVRVLVEVGADTGARDAQGNTPEDAAAQHGSWPECKRSYKYLRHWRTARVVAFAMGQHERLGGGARVRALDPNVVRTICEGM
jgi:ankyrin repeat protein